MTMGRFKILITGGMFALVPGVLAPGALAAASTAPKLSVAVQPKTVRPNERYKIVLTVSYNKRALRTTPYLVAFLQYAGSACKATAKAENALPVVELDYAGSVRNSTFTRTDHWTAGARKGSRRACAYLYPFKVSPKSNTKPLLTASASFQNV